MIKALSQALPGSGQPAPMPPQAQQLLSQLNDVITPGEISVWPLAPGWWILILLVVSALVGAVLWLYKRHKASLYRRAAIQQLIKLKFENHPNFIAQNSVLLKRVVLSCAPRARAHVGQLHGQAWVDFLNACCPEPVFKGETANALASAQYQANTDLDLASLKTQVLAWVKNHKLHLVHTQLNQRAQAADNLTRGVAGYV